ncbi:MAG: type II/IV secretion system protein [Tissierellia bacterium]|nr:type II/IV secretion system protein [Tissierellia bacterium]
MSKIKIEDLLVYYGKITQEQLNMTLKKNEYSRKNIIDLLIEEGYVTDDDVVEVLEWELGIPSIDLNEQTIDPNIVSMIPENMARRYEMIPVNKNGKYLYVAMVDPMDIYAIDDISLYTNCEIKPLITKRNSILHCIDKYYTEKQRKNILDEITEHLIYTDHKQALDEEVVEVASSPIIRLLDSIIEQAIEMRASDIHIEPFADKLRVRYRIDGDLREMMTLPKVVHPPLVTRIKIIGQMDIADKRIPQDGRIENIINEKKIDMRISTVPTIYGEKVVLRLLDRENFLLAKSEIGFTEKNYENFNKLIQQPFGMILITGPAGSGKTTTLYSILKELNKAEKNIITIEDPVEYKLEGINQIQINPKAGLTFASGLRSILRQDPDIIMIGEIRDSETAQIATRAAVTGHLVLSTLHTKDSPSSITRLIDMGVEPYLVSAAIVGVISQRLVKKLCDYCKEPYSASYSEKILLGLDPEEDVILFKAKGCNRCNNGYYGRIAVHEIMIINEEIRRIINAERGIDELRELAIKSGMSTIMDNSVELALKGISSLDEILRICFVLD